MAGGKYTTMNKVIPGVYFAIQNQKAATSELTPTGVLAWVASQPWGDTVTQITLDDYARDKCYLKIGRHNTDDHLQIFGNYCNTLICVNPAQGRSKASAQIRASEADATQLYLKIGIRTSAPALASNLFSITTSMSGTKMTLSLSATGQDPVPPGYNKTIEIKDLVDGKDDVYVAEMYKEDGGNFKLVVGADSYTDASGGLSAEPLSSATLEGNAKWFGPSSSSGSPRCKRLVGALSAEARYEGSLGNLISIVVVPMADGKKEVRTTVDGVVVDKQRIANWSRFVDNDYIVLSGERSGSISVTAAINLSGGSDGRVTADPIATDAWTASSVDYRFVALENNLNVDGLKLSAAEGTINLVKTDGSVVSSVSYQTTTPHSLSFDLEDGNVLNLKLQDVSGNDIDDATTVAVFSADIALNGGNHGTIAGLDPAIEELSDLMWNYVVCEDQSEIVRNALIQFVSDLGDRKGKYRKCVVCDKQSYPLIVNSVNNPVAITLGQAMDDDAPMTAFAVAAMSAGASWNESITYAPIPLDGKPNIVLTDDQLEEWIMQGIMCISKREDGAWCITKDINSLHDLEEEDMPSDMMKNRAMRCIDTVRNTLKFVWETEFAGKITNNDSGRLLWKSRVLSILSVISDGEGIEPVDSDSVVVLPGDTKESVLTQIAMSLYDSAEIVYVNLVL